MLHLSELIHYYLHPR